MPPAHRLALDEKPTPPWLKAVASRVDELVERPTAFDHFQQMLRTWAVEHEARGPSTPVDRDGAIRYHRDVELIPTRRLTLPEKYQLLAVIHDEICETAKCISPWGSGARRQKNLKRLKAGIPYFIRCGQVKDITDGDRARVEKALQDVQVEVARAIEIAERRGPIVYGVRSFRSESLAAAIFHLIAAEDTGPATRSDHAINTVEGRWVALQAEIQKKNIISAAESRDFEERLHELIRERIELLKPFPHEPAAQARVMNEDRAWTRQARKLALYADEIEKRVDAPAAPKKSSATETAADDYSGFVPADKLEMDGIRPNRLSEAATAGLVRTRPAPKGLKDSLGREIRSLYHHGDAIKHCLPKRSGNKRPRR